ncbi:MAG: hypothetical protein J0M08_01415 [Bacteroidetes bacterium]|nr:hypothetical protein [Bacteroidota bacterium]
MRFFFVVFLVFLMYTIDVFSCSTIGPNDPSTIQVLARSGSSSGWSNSTNLATSNNSYASNTSNLASSGNYTDYIIARNFGFTVPGGCFVSSITFSIEISNPNGSTPNIIDDQVRLLVNGAIQAPCNAASGANWPTSDTYRTYTFSLMDYCGNPVDVTSSFFGIAISVKRGTGSGTAIAQIDHVSATLNLDTGIPPCGEACPVNLGLPIELTDFSVSNKMNQVVQINWTTNSELNNNYFTLEKSIDAMNFKPIAFLEGKGNSFVINNYSYQDFDIIEGVFYYRLKQTDFDGEFFYSTIKWVEIAKIQKNQVLYDIEGGLIYIYLYQDFSCKRAKLELIDAFGRARAVPNECSYFSKGKLVLDVTCIDINSIALAINTDNTCEVLKIKKISY